MSILQKIVLISLMMVIIGIAQLGSIWYGMDRVKTQIVRLDEHENIILLKAKDTQFAVAQVQQWLTDISATRGLDGLDDGFNEAENYAQRFRSLMAELKTLDPENLERYREMISVFEDYYAAGQRMAKAYVAEGPSAGNQLMKDFDQAAATIVGRLESFLASAQLRVDEHIEVQKQQINTTEIVAAVSFFYC